MAYYNRGGPAKYSPDDAFNALAGAGSSLYSNAGYNQLSSGYSGGVSKPFQSQSTPCSQHQSAGRREIEWCSGYMPDMR